MEDSTFEGWTTQPAGVMNFPEGRRVERPPHGYVGELRGSLPKASLDQIKYATQRWPQGRAESFDREGRTFTERATGIIYQLVRGNPLLGDDPDAADLFVVEDEVLWFLRRTDRPSARSVSVGTLWGDA